MIKSFSLLALVFILASCGPRRMQCGPKQRCVKSVKEIKNNPTENNYYIS